MMTLLQVDSGAEFGGEADCASTEGMTVLLGALWTSGVSTLYLPMCLSLLGTQKKCSLGEQTDL